MLAIDPNIPVRLLGLDPEQLDSPAHSWWLICQGRLSGLSLGGVKSSNTTNNPCKMITFHSDATEGMCSSLLQLINRKPKHYRGKRKSLKI